jgi:4-alpha-glucanotransferase
MEWWERLDEFDRQAFAALPGMKSLAKKERFDEEVWRALLELTFSSASATVLLPVFDVLALRQRVNTPNTMGPENWSTRLPHTFDALASDAIARGRARFVRELAQRSGRTP